MVYGAHGAKGIAQSIKAAALGLRTAAPQLNMLHIPRGRLEVRGRKLKT